MANVRKEDRVQDTDIKRLNHVGLGLKAIAQELGCHPATITLRLKAAGIEPTDTRRSFMEQVYNSLNQDERDWLSHNLFNHGITVKEFVTQMIREAFEESGGLDAIAAAPVPMPTLNTRSNLPTVVTGGKTNVNDEPLDGMAYGPEDEPSPDQMVDPEPVLTIPVKKPASVPEKKKLDFNKKK